MLDSLASLRRSFAAFSNWYYKNNGDVIQCYNYQPGDAISVEDWLNSAVDEVESEIEKKYMELPVDVDGEPIHVGDMMNWEYEEEKFTVCAVAPGRVHHWVHQDGKRSTVDYPPVQCTHYKPRTIEDVLEDFQIAVLDINDEYDDEQVELFVVELDNARSKCADELRQMGVDNE